MGVRRGKDGKDDGKGWPGTMSAHVRENSSDFLVYLEGLAHRPVHQRSLPQTYSPREWDLLPSVPVVELVQGHCTSQVDLAVLGELVADIRRHYYRMLGITSRLTLTMVGLVPCEMDCVHGATSARTRP